MTVRLPDGLEHIPVRPAMACAECGEEWPCDQAKDQLLAEYASDPLSLATYLGAQLADALDQAFQDQAWKRVDTLYDRFMGWRDATPTPENGRPHAA